MSEIPMYPDEYLYDERTLRECFNIAVRELGCAQAERAAYRAALADMVADTPGARVRAIDVLRNGPPR